MKQYRFSPIESKDQLIEAVEYVVKQATKLYFRVVGDAVRCDIKYATIFAHYNDEFEKIKKLLEQLGTSEEANNGVGVKLSQPLVVASGSIERDGETKTVTHQVEYIRVRKPDHYRMQVGCFDFEVDDDDELGGYWGFKDYYGMHSDNPRTIKCEGYEMLEFNNQDVDVLAYMVSPGLRPAF